MKIGDEVSVIDEALGGVVTSVHGTRVVFKDEFGFTHTYAVSKLIKRDATLYDNVEVKPKAEPVKTISKKHLKQVFTLDLHFESLVKNALDYSSFERLFIQKEKLLQTLDFCRSHKIRELRIVHGIGDGVLQKLVIDVLEAQTNIEYRHSEILLQQSGAILVEFL